MGTTMINSRGCLSNDNGATLFEVVVAVAVLALLSVPVSQSFLNGAKTWTKIESRLSQNDKVYLQKTKILHWIENAHPIDTNRVPGELSYPLEGGVNSLSFSSPIHPDPNHDVLYRVHLGIGVNDTLDIAVLPDGYSGELDWRPLVKGINQISFRYLEAISSDGQPIWVQNWISQFNLPLAVEVTIQATDESDSWGPEVVPMKVKERAFCAFDAVSRKCRTGATAG